MERRKTGKKHCVSRKRKDKKGCASRKRIAREEEKSKRRKSLETGCYSLIRMTQSYF